MVDEKWHNAIPIHKTWIIALISLHSDVEIYAQPIVLPNFGQESIAFPVVFIYHQNQIELHRKEWDMALQIKPSPLHNQKGFLGWQIYLATVEKFRLPAPRTVNRLFREHCAMGDRNGVTIVRTGGFFSYIQVPAEVRSADMDPFLVALEKELPRK